MADYLYVLVSLNCVYSKCLMKYFGRFSCIVFPLTKTGLELLGLLCAVSEALSWTFDTWCAVCGYAFRVNVSILLLIMSLNKFFCSMCKSTGNGFIIFLYYLSWISLDIFRHCIRFIALQLWFTFVNNIEHITIPTCSEHILSITFT